MIIELEINGAHVIVSGENLTVNVTDGNEPSENAAIPLPTAELISALRSKLGMNQEEFAKHLGVAQATVPRWEGGAREPHGQMARKLASLLAEPRAKSFGGISALRDWMDASRGRGASLAAALDVTQGAIVQWHEIPAHRVVAIESFTGIKRQVLRPDLYEGMEA